MDVGSVARLGSGLAAVLLAAVLVASLWERRRQATARSLLGVAVTMLLGSGLHLVVVELSGPGGVLAVTGWETGGLLWVVLGATTTIVAGGLWSIFAVQYTGRARKLFWGVVASVAFLATGSTSIAVLAVRSEPSLVLIEALTLGFLLTGFLVTVGVFLLLWASVEQNAFPFREPLLLSGGIIVLLSGIHVAQVFEEPALYPTVVTLSCVCFLVPVVRYPIFETLPAARVAGRDNVVDEMVDGVLVVDRDGRIRDLNAAAEALFDGTRSSILRERLPELLERPVAPEDVLTARDAVRVTPDANTTLELTGNRVTDQRNRSFGYLLLCEDVTDRQTREEQLTLLSRFVADIVREGMVDVSGEVSAVFDEGKTGVDDTDAADRIWETATELTTLVAQAREIEDAIADESDGARPIPDLGARIEGIAGRVATDDGPELTVDTENETEPVDCPGELFEAVLRNLLENAYEQASDRVAVEVRNGERPTVLIRSDGKRSADRSASRGPQDLAVDVGRLAVEQIGGELSVTRRNGDGQSVTVRLPKAETEETSEPVRERGQPTPNGPERSAGKR